MNLYLYLYTRENTRQLHLDGASVETPIKGALYRAGVGAVHHRDGQEAITEEIKIGVAGSLSQVQSLLDTLTELLESAARLALSAFDRLYLRAEFEDLGITWQSVVLSGKVTPSRAGLAARELGAEVLSLELTRLNFWQDCAGESVPISNQNGIRQPSLTVYNHTDSTSGHNNYIDISKEDIPGDLPTPLELTLLHANAGRTVSQVWLALLETSGALPAWLPVYEGELGLAGAGVSLTGTADSASSAGHFGCLNWTAGAEARVVSFALSSAHMSAFGGKPYKPFIRLANPHAYPDLWLKARVTYGAGHSAAYDSGWVQSTPSAPYVEFNPVRLPPYPARSMTHDTMYLSLYALKTASASVQLDVDFLALLPTDGFNRLDMLEAVPAGVNIQEGEQTGSYRWSSTTLYALPSHARAGRSLYLTPGFNARLFILHRSGATMPIDTTFTASVYVYGRRKYL